MNNVCIRYRVGVMMAVLLVLQVSCKLSAPDLSVLSGDFVPPKLLAMEVVDEQTIRLEFSKSLSSVNAVIFSDGTEPQAAECVAGEDGIILLKPSNPSVVGAKYTIEGSVNDKNGNTLTFLAEFSGFNGNVPNLVLSEVRTEYSKPKVEFIELYAQTAGNLGGVYITNAADGAEKAYEFPPAEVQAGEYIVLHLRVIEDGTIDETDAGIVSAGTEAHADARDFWQASPSARIAKTDVILLYERKTGPLLDALLLCESKKTAWPKVVYEEAALEAFTSGVWTGGSGVEYAAQSDYTTTTRTVSRRGDLQTAKRSGREDWIVVDTSCATPGAANSEKKYVPKK